jgi:hypothetical protein
LRGSSILRYIDEPGAFSDETAARVGFSSEGEAMKYLSEQFATKWPL